MTDQRIDKVEYEDDFDDCLSNGSMPINPLYLEKLEREKRELAEQQRETVPQALVSQPIPSAEREHHQEENQSKAEVVASRIDVDTINNAFTEARSIPVPAKAEVQMEESAPEPFSTLYMDYLNSQALCDMDLKEPPE
jgi:hypothetical protein